MARVKQLAMALEGMSAAAKSLAQCTEAIAATAEALGELVDTLRLDYTAEGAEHEGDIGIDLSSAEDMTSQGDETVQNEDIAGESNSAPAEEQPAPEKAKKSAPKKAKTIAMEDVRAVMMAKIKDGKRDAVQALIAKHNASKLSEVNADEYDALIKELEEI